MIKTRTAPADFIDFGRVFEIAPNTYRNADTGEIIITDGNACLVIEVETSED